MTPDKLFHVCDLFPALLSAFSIGVVVGGLTALCAFSFLFAMQLTV